jgi:hypothetical protein
MGAKGIKKIQKNGNPARGVMICYVVPRKNTKHGIPSDVYALLFL